MFFALALLTSPISLTHAQELTCSDVIKKMETAVGGMTSVNFQFVETCEDEVKCDKIYKSSRPDWLKGQPINYFYHDPTLAMAYAYVPTDDGGNTYQLSALTQVFKRADKTTKIFESRQFSRIGMVDDFYTTADRSSVSNIDIVDDFHTPNKYNCTKTGFQNSATCESPSFPDWPTYKGLLTLIQDRINQSVSCKVEETNEKSTKVYNLNILETNQKEGLRIEVDPSNWLPNKLLGYERNKVFLTSEWKNVQTNEKSVEHSGDIKSLTITHAGLIRPAANKENCFYALPTKDVNIFDTSKTSEDSTCYQIEDRTTIPAAWGLEMGITFKIETDGKDTRPIPLIISWPYQELRYADKLTNFELNLIKKLPQRWQYTLETTLNKRLNLKTIYDESASYILVEPGKEYLFKLGPTDGTLYPFLHFGKKYPSFKEAAWVELFYYNEKLGEQKFAFEDPKDPYAFLGTYGRNIPEFEKRVKKNPKDFNAHYLLAKGYSEMKSDTRTTEEFGKAIELNPKFIPAYLDRAEYMQRKGFSHKLILNDYYKVIDLGRNYLPELYPKIVELTHENLRDLYIRTENYFAEAIKKDPQNPKLFYNRGLFYKDAGEIQKALADFQKTLELDPNFKDAQEQIKILQEKPVEKN